MHKIQKNARNTKEGEARASLPCGKMVPSPFPMDLLSFLLAFILFIDLDSHRNDIYNIHKIYTHTHLFHTYYLEPKSYKHIQDILLPPKTQPTKLSPNITHTHTHIPSTLYPTQEEKKMKERKNREMRKENNQKSLIYEDKK